MEDYCGIDRIYVNHFSELTSRKSYLDKTLPEIGVPYEFIIHTKETDQNLLNYYDLLVKCYRRLSVGEFVITMSHLRIFSDIVKNNYNTCLILEDDAVFSDLFFENIKGIVEESKKYDFSFLSDCCGLSVEKTSNTFLYDSNSSRGCCAYLVNNTDKFKKFVDTPFPVINVIDWFLNNIKPKFELNYSWCEPPVIIQGSENQFYNSNLR